MDERREIRMQRRKAIATAGTITAGATAAVIAFGANFGIFGLAQDDSNVGKFPAVETTSTVPAATSPTSSSHDRSPAETGQDDGHRPELGDDHGADHDDD
jgi:hypothetical protein